jgi:hypothetical protein
MKYDKHMINKNLETISTWNNDETYKNPLEKVLSIDDKCLCAMGWGDRPYVNKNTCVGCELLRRVSKDVKTPEDGILMIETGNYIGQCYSITNIENFLSPFSENFESLKIHEKLKLITDLKIDNQVKYFSTISPVSNYVAVCSFIYNKLSRHRIPCIPLFEWAYQCSKNSIIVENYPNLGIGNFNTLIENPEYGKNPVSPTARKFQSLSIKNNVMISILKQLISSLHFLSQYGFAHNSPTIKYLAFSRKAIHYKYDNIDISSPITLHIIPSYFSSVTITSTPGGETVHTGTITQDVRLFNKSNNTMYKESTNPIEKIEYFVGHKTEKDCQVSTTLIPMMKELEDNLVLGYKIGCKLSLYLDLTVKRGIEIYSDSFNFYMFICSLLSEEAFYMSFSENEKLIMIWYNLWKPSEFEKINDQIRNFRSREYNDPVPFEELYEVVSQYTLREDGLSYFWNCIKNL